MRETAGAGLRQTSPIESRAAALVIGVATALSIGFSLSSPQGILQFDDLTHFLYAKWAWQWPAYLLDDWGRPGFTVLYWLPAGLGWWACRVLSGLISAAAAWCAFLIARDLQLRHAWGVAAMAFAQPLFFQLSQTTLTETPLALYLALSVLLANRGRWEWSAAVLSVGFVTRHEAVLFLPIWLWVAWRRGTAIWRLWPAVAAPAAVNLLCAVAGMPIPLERFLHPTPSGDYGSGGWLTYFCRTLEAWGPGITVLAMIGIPRLFRLRRGGLVSAAIVAYFGAQTAIRALGLFDSGGYARFLVPIGPLVAVAGLVGWQRFWSDERRTWVRATAAAAGSMVLLWIAMERQLALYRAGRDLAAELPELHNAERAVQISTIVFVLLAGAVVAAARISPRPFLRLRAVPPIALIGLIGLAVYGLCHPLRPPAESPIIEEVLAWREQRGWSDREIISANVWLDWASGRDLPPDRTSVRRQLQEAPIGTLFAWEDQFAPATQHGLQLREFAASPSFERRLETRSRPYETRPYLIVFEKVAAW